MALTEKQKQEREASLGSSDAPVVAGVSSYSSPLELHYKLTGALPRYSDEETQAQRIGSRLEPVIAEMAAEDLGVKIRRMPGRVHPKHPFMSAHADFEIVSNAKGPALMEVKNRSGEKPWDSVSDPVLLQVAHQLAVTNREWAVVAVLFSFGVLKTYEVQRDKELEEYLIEIEMRFMAGVQSNTPPSQTWTPENLGILKKLYPASSDKVITFPSDKLVLINEYQSAKLALERAEADKARWQGELQSIMQDAAVAEIPGWGQLTWKSTKPSQRFDEDAFKAEHPDLYKQFMKSVPGYRRFLVKPTKDIAT